MGCHGPWRLHATPWAGPSCGGHHTGLRLQIHRLRRPHGLRGIMGWGDPPRAAATHWLWFSAGLWRCAGPSGCGCPKGCDTLANLFAAATPMGCGEAMAYSDGTGWMEAVHGPGEPRDRMGCGDSICCRDPWCYAMHAHELRATHSCSIPRRAPAPAHSRCTLRFPSTGPIGCHCVYTGRYRHDSSFAPDTGEQNALAEGGEALSVTLRTEPVREGSRNAKPANSWRREAGAALRRSSHARE